jgi:hypothetical protein
MPLPHLCLLWLFPSLSKDYSKLEDSYGRKDDILQQNDTGTWFGFSSLRFVLYWLSLGIYCKVVARWYPKGTPSCKGYTQTYGVDYSETFSHVAKISLVQILISLIANLGWPLFQLNVEITFLHDDLHQEVHMEQSPRAMKTLLLSIMDRVRRFGWSLVKFGS